MQGKDRAYWLADKIPALGDYAKEAAIVLREQADEIERLTATLVLARDWLPYHEPSHPDYEGERSDVGRAVRAALDECRN